MLLVYKELTTLLNLSLASVDFWHLLGRAAIVFWHLSLFP